MVEQTLPMKELAGALLALTPERFSSINCSVRQLDNQCQGRLAMRNQLREISGRGNHLSFQRAAPSCL